MSVRRSSGSSFVSPKLYQTASFQVISNAEKQDRFLNLGELDQFVTYLRSGEKRLEIATVLSRNANTIVSAAADRIFVGGSPLSFLERPQAAVTLTPEQASATTVQPTQVRSNFWRNLFSAGVEAGFRPINVVRYGVSNMRKSLRDLDWFLRYVTYAIVAGDASILEVNTRGLRELIDKACNSAAALVALKEMRRVSLTLFTSDKEASELVQNYFDTLINAFAAPTKADLVRRRSTVDAQGLKLPSIYRNNIAPRYVMKPNLSSEERKQVIRACYRQVFERDIVFGYGLSLGELESKALQQQISIKEFIRALGQSEIYRRQFYQPFVNSRVVELAFKHFLGRAPSSLKEWNEYFAIVSSRGLKGLVDALINSKEYADYFGEETVPYLRQLGEEAQECRNWGAQLDLFNYSAPFRQVPQLITLYKDYESPLPQQHVYGRLNDPLPIRFGAIFARETVKPNPRPVNMGRDVKRIVIYQGAGINNERGTTNPCQLPSALPQDRLEANAPIERQIQAAIIRVFGRDVYQEQKQWLKPLENELRRKTITLREFIRQLAKSDEFRNLYWSRLYVCKAIEYIHIRLLGRPTYGRREIEAYFDIAAKSGFYTLIDAMVDSEEYKRNFGDQTVPYDRYRAALSSSASTSAIRSREEEARFIQLAQAGKGYKPKKQGVQRIGQYELSLERQDRLVVFEAAVRQIFERNMWANKELETLQVKFLQGEMSVRELVKALATTKLYVKEFYQPYPNTQVIELATKHILGRAVLNQAEIRYYNQILAREGLEAMVSRMVNSAEYRNLFGENQVPYRRFPTLPAANFPNTQKLYNRLTKQNRQLIVPSFGSRIDLTS
jgi:phycobilisome core-membrane linker protein|uniref:Phycobiliprotein ApcE n=2 Tax=Cyanidioschyzon merolae TaxID=45157 RepID=Q85FW8_CYAM1|nr:phycobillisome linker protein [Cyanidioschyzon merolae strain 10D]QFV17014.1 phycobilisome linker polypeptide [Cyanidioschyzon merolae]QFV17190.1 phycobilisome linker polypeptide [Cyanidioschyzon merolae]BAC76225.1 phycobilisome linker polypeptide [Cyanidioschyzon merolae strain 10D]